MILAINDWKFEIDLTATMEYSSAEAADHCTCAYCRNFYATVDTVYPNLRPFLAQFGVDIEAPDELMTFDPTQYLGAYAVSGSILQFGSECIRVHGAAILPERAEDAMVNTECPGPYFVLTVGPLTLPWVLDEAMEEVISPANEPSFLKRMWRRLLGRLPEDPITS